MTHVLDTVESVMSDYNCCPIFIFQVSVETITSTVTMAGILDYVLTRATNTMTELYKIVY